MSDGSIKEVAMATLAGANVNAFIGWNGPYRADTNLDGVIDFNDTLNANAIGVAVDELNFAISLMASTNVLEPATYLAMKATAVEAGFMGHSYL